MKKRILSLFVAALLLVSTALLTGCQTGSAADTAQATEPSGPPDRSGFTLTPDPNQSPEEQEVIKILSIGNSHSQDSAWLLAEVLRTEMPEQKFVVAELYFPGAMTEHLSNAYNNEPVYDYQLNIDGTWQTTAESTIAYGLRGQYWDVIVINESSRHIGLENILKQNLIQQFIDYIYTQINYKPYLMYNWTWSQPTDQTFYGLDFDPQPPANFWNTFTGHYEASRVTHYNMMRDMVIKYVEPNPDFDLVLYSATPIQYATEVLGVPQTDLYRDYTHLSDYGRLYSAYLWYAQLFNLEKIDAVNLDKVNANLRNRRFVQFGDLELTQEMKEQLVQSVNYALQNPLQMPE